MPFLINEDRALKARLEGLAVHDRTSPPEGRPVEVYFRFPQKEIVDADYPFITIDLIDVQRAPEREHRGRVELPYLPEGREEAGELHSLIAEFPIPVWLYYVVTAYTRHPLHSREIDAALLGGPIPLRFGSREDPAGLEIEEDNTLRHLEHLGYTADDTVDRDGKIVFRKGHALRVSSEKIEEEVEEIHRVINANLVLRQSTNEENTSINENLGA